MKFFNNNNISIKHPCKSFYDSSKKLLYPYAKTVIFLTIVIQLSANPKNGLTHSNNLSAVPDELFVHVWPFFDVDT